MLTPQEVSERAFQKASFGGYNMAQVDEFLDILTGDYSALFNENAVLKNKMKVLVDKVEEYRSTEEAMRKALLAAQRMADDLVKEAERKKDELLAQTEKDVVTRRAELSHELEAEEYRLKKAQEQTAAFVEKVRALHMQEAEYLAQLEGLCPPMPGPPPTRCRRRPTRLTTTSSACWPRPWKPPPPKTSVPGLRRRRTGTCLTPPSSPPASPSRRTKASPRRRGGLPGRGRRPPSPHGQPHQLR